MDSFEEIDKRIAQKRQAEDVKLEAARAEARKAGKEAFDFKAFQVLYDISGPFGDGKATPEAERYYEVKYYLDFPETKSLEDFAHQMELGDPYR